MSTLDNISPDDPRLTTYALGEMEPAERAEFEQLLLQDEAARATVAAITGTAQSIGTALASEPMPQTVPVKLDQPAIIPGRDRRKLDGGPLLANQVTNLRRGLAKLLRFPQMYFTISGLAVACFAVGFILWEAGYLQKQQVQYTEIDLAKFKTTGSAQSKGAAGPEQKLLADGQSHAGEPADAEPALEVGLQPAQKDQSEEKGGFAQETREKAEKEATASEVVSDTKKGPADGFANSPSLPGNAPVAAVTASREEGKRVATQAVIGAVALDKQSYGELRFDPQFQPERMKLARPRGQIGGGSGASGDRITDNPFYAVRNEPLSTFPIEVATAAYVNVRRLLQNGQRPPSGAVRIEELVNYFPYHYAPPDSELHGKTNAPAFAVYLEVAGAPWAPEHRLVRIGLKGREMSEATRPSANFVFLLDVSRSMNEPNKLPLVKESLHQLVDKLRRDDRVAIVVYSGASGLVLPSTPAAGKQVISEAIDTLHPGGTASGATGIQLAYDIAKANFVKQGINRIVLCTDGNFDVGVANRGELTRMVEEQAKSGISLTALGFGMGKIKNATLEQLADIGNGHFGYIDSRREAQQLLVKQAGGTQMPIAKDVKIQVEFNPAQVQAYRLIGYENRTLRPEEFNNDKIDAGEIRSGHAVTALYEVVPTGLAWTPESSVDGLNYQTPAKPALPDASKFGQEPALGTASSEMLTLKLRYNEPDGAIGRNMEFPLRDSGGTFEQASADFKFASAVAAFGMILRESPHKGGATFARVADWAHAGLVDDAGGYRAEFVGLVGRADRLSQN